MRQYEAISLMVSEYHSFNFLREAMDTLRKLRTKIASEYYVLNALMSNLIVIKLAFIDINYKAISKCCPSRLRMSVQDNIDSIFGTSKLSCGAR